MQDRSNSENLIKQIRRKHIELAGLYERLNKQLTEDLEANNEAVTRKYTHIARNGYTLNVGCIVKVLTTSLAAKKGQYATVTKLHKKRVEISAINRGKPTLRKPENLEWVSTGEDELSDSE